MSGCRRQVIVVGAGPAGANAALHLARGGAHVTLVEKVPVPRYKTCGGGVVARASKHVPADVAWPVQRECFAVDMRLGVGGATYRVERERPLVSMTMRAELDAALADAARRAGAEFLDACAVRAIARGADYIELETERGALRADYVVIADGATGPCARLAGWTDPVETIPALEAEVRVSPDDFARHADSAVFDYATVEAGYGWVFPKREHLSCGVLTMRRGNAGLRAALERYLESAGVRAIEPIETHGYVIPIRPRRGGLARDRVLLAGDAAGLADPVTGEGISLALHSGKLAAEAVLESSSFASGVERAYERSVRAEILSELRIASVLAHVLYQRPKIARKLFDRSAQEMCEAMADVASGATTYRATLARPANWIAMIQALLGMRGPAASASRGRPVS